MVNQAINTTILESLPFRSWPEALRVAAKKLPKKLAFIFEGPSWRRTLNYEDWYSSSLSAARVLRLHGVVQGDFIGLLGPGTPAWPILQIALSSIGATVVPLNPRWQKDEISSVLNTIGLRLILLCRDIGHPTAISNILQAVKNSPTVLGYFSRDYIDLQIDKKLSPGLNYDRTEKISLSPIDTPNPIALLQFTSGTTAYPKSVPLTQLSTMLVAKYLGDRIGVTSDDIVYSTQPFHHVGGTVCTTLMPLVHQCTLVVPEHYSAEQTFSSIQQNGCTARYGQAAMYNLELNDSGFNSNIFKSVKKGWAIGSDILIHKIHEQMGITHLVQLYGLSEASGVSVVGDWRDSEEHRLESCGKPFPGIELRIQPISRKSSSPQTEGEILLRGWGVMQGGYYKAPSDQIDVIDEDGWLHTGDIGYVNQDGYLFYTDRLKDMIKPGGENVAPAEIERVLLAHPAVRQACVVGIADTRLGEVPKAYIELRPGANLTEIEVIDYCRVHVASYKVPRQVAFVLSWPMTASGKISKATLRAQHLDCNKEDIIGLSG